ncbi:MAG: uroporphyrinogen-III synthase [Gammaproteobacteria bacterium]|nr:uroporphyrinogen-III synthase [Gammaproteobacteria bacterium]
MVTSVSAGSGCHLKGLSVLVTRAHHQADGLCRLIEDLGGCAIPFPAVEITAMTPSSSPLPIDQYDLVLFVSPNAVHYGSFLLDDRSPDQSLVGAVGRATAEALGSAGVQADLVPTRRYDSEGMLALPELNRVSGRRVLIVRGDGGRALLGDTLEQRGAQVDYAEVYQRRCPLSDPSFLLARRYPVGWVTATSNGILDNLFTLLGERGKQLLKTTPLVVVSERMRQHARKRGCEQVILAQGASDQALMDAICNDLKTRFC